MRLPALIGPAACVILTACGPSIAVQTVGGPTVDLSTLQTFRMLPTPAPRDMDWWEDDRTVVTPLASVSVVTL